MKNMLMMLCLFVLVFSCATAQKDPFPEAKITTADDSFSVHEKNVIQLKNRINEYWGWRVKDNYTKAFDYEDPKTKETYNVDLEKYLSNKARLDYHGIRITNIDFIREDYAKVVIWVDYTFNFFEPIRDEKDIIDRWVKRNDGKWYRLFTTGPGQPLLEN